MGYVHGLTGYGTSLDVGELLMFFLVPFWMNLMSEH